MLTGEITQDSFGNVFRALSRSQKNGVLSVTTEAGVMNVLFQEGKIVGVQRSDEPAVVSICRKLAAAGFLVEKVVRAVESSQVGLGQLFELLVGKQYVTQEEFVRAKQASELDLLYSLRELDHGVVDFKPKLVRSDPRFSLSVYPGQVLLDITEYLSDQERFRALFDGPTATSVRIFPKEEMELRLEGGEEIVLDIAVEGADPLTIFQQSLLSEYHTMEALLSLFEQEMIQIVSLDEQSENLIREAESQELDDLTETSEPVEAEVRPEAIDQGLFTDQEEVESAEQAHAEAESSEKVRERVASAVHLLQQMSAEDQAGACEEKVMPSAVKEDAVSSDAANDLLTNEAQVRSDALSTGSEDAAPVSVAHDQSETQEDSQPPVVSSVKWTDRLWAFNFQLQEPAVVRKTVVLVTLIYLMVFALVGSDLFEKWFHALAHFTSNA